MSTLEAAALFLGLVLMFAAVLFVPFSVFVWPWLVASVLMLWPLTAALSRRVK